MKYLRSIIVGIVVLSILTVMVDWEIIQAEEATYETVICQEKDAAIVPASESSDSDLAKEIKPASGQIDEPQLIETNQLEKIEIKIEEELGDGSRFVIKTEGASNYDGIKRVFFPTWTERNGQDDLKWYQATRANDGEYHFSVDTKNHGFETGSYHIHAYFYGDHETFLKVSFQNYQPITSELKIEMSEIENNCYRILIVNPNNRSGVGAISVPTWSSTGGHDDIRWEQANYLGQNTWEAVIQLKHYSRSYDQYISHVYMRDLNGNNHFMGEIRKEIKNPFIEDPIRIDFHMDQGKGRFTINTDNFKVKSGIEKVSFAVWTERNGQDDLKWYAGDLGANGEYNSLVDIESHGFETGKYIIHTYVYGRQNEQIAMSGHGFKMEKGEITLGFDQAVLNNTYKVRIKNVSGDNGVKAVYIPTWSSTGGQDDVRWEGASYIGNKTWEATINLRDYRRIVDNFYSHAYLINQNNEMEFLNSGTKKITHNTETIYGFFAYPLDKKYQPNPHDPTDWFGPRWGRIHEGIDIPAPYYAKCYSACHGVVERAGYFLGYGRYVRIRTTDRYGESVSFFYGHLREIHVSQGQTVAMGQVIGSVGGSGYNSQKAYIEDAYGPHLHFGAIANADDACVDPEIWIDFHQPYQNR